MPSLRERIGDYIAGRGQRTVTQPFEFDEGQGSFFGPGIGTQPRFETLLAESRGIFNAAKRTLANRVASLDLLVKTTRRVTDGTVEEETLDDHPMKLLLDRPHPDLSKSQLLRLTVDWIVDTGEAHWLKVGNGFGVPTEFQPVKPGSIWPIIDRNRISGYRVLDAMGAQTTIPATSVVRFYLPDPENPMGAEGYLAPLGIDVDSTKFAGQHLRSHYQHDATPKTMLQAASDAKPPLDDQMKRFFELWRQHYHNRSGDRMGLPGISPAGYELVQMAMQSGSDVTPLLEHWRDNTLMGVGTPRSVLGQVVSGDRSSAETNFWVYDKVTVSPLTGMIADALTLQLAPDFDASLTVEFEDFVSTDKEFELKRERQDLELSIRTPNKILTDRNDDEVSHGDIPLRVAKLKPIDPKTGEDLTPPPAAPPESPTLPPEGGGEPEPPEGEDVDLEPDDDGDRSRARQDEPEDEGNEEALALIALLIAPLDEEAPNRALRDVIAATAVAFGEDAFSIADTEATFDAEQPAVAEYLENGEADKLREVTKTTKDAIATAVTGLAAGVSVAAAIRSVFETARESRAPTIARTTTVPAANFGTEQGLVQAGIPLKDWISERDDKVRDPHVTLDNAEPIPVDDPFVTESGATAQYPGGFGVPELDINCRCVIAPAGPAAESDEGGRMFVGRESRESEWQRQDDARLVFEKIALGRMQKVFTAQEKQVLAALKGRERAMHILVRQMVRGGRAA